jgi:hypothetical protein
MFTFDRETATIAVVIVCIAATLYMYRELKMTKDEFTAAIALKQRPVMYLNPDQPTTGAVKTIEDGEEEEEVPAAPPPAPAPVAVKRKKAEKESAQ